LETRETKKQRKGASGGGGRRKRPISTKRNFQGGLGSSENRIKPKDGRWQPERKYDNIYTAPKVGMAGGVGRKDRPLENRMNTLWATRGGGLPKNRTIEFEITTKTHPSPGSR
jgi:hypothetical protein